MEGVCNKAREKTGGNVEQGRVQLETFQVRQERSVKINPSEALIVPNLNALEGSPTWPKPQKSLARSSLLSPFVCNHNLGYIATSANGFHIVRRGRVTRQARQLPHNVRLPLDCPIG